MLLSNLIPEFSSARQKHDSELGLTVLSFKEHFAVSIKIFSNCVTTESLPCQQRSLLSPRRTRRKKDLGEQPLEIAVSSMRDRRHDVTRHSHVLCRMWFGFLFLNLSCFNIPGICVDLSWAFQRLCINMHLK